MLILAVSFVTDFLWMVYWVPHWESSEMAKWNLGVHRFVAFCSFANWVLKLIILGTLATVNKDELKNKVGQLRNKN